MSPAPPAIGGNMLYLILAVLASSLVAIIMRFSEGRASNSFALFAANYFVCALEAFLFTEDKNIFAPREGLPFALCLGLISGCLYLTCFVLLRYNIGKNGVMLSSVFMKLGVIVPVLIAVLFFGEVPTGFKLAGFVLAAAAVIVIYAEPSDGALHKGFSKTSLLLLLLLLVSGFTESMANLYDKLGAAALKDNFLFFNFATAFLLSLSITVFKRKRVRPADVLFGVAIGIPNYFCSRFLLLSLGELPSFVVYPVYNVGAIVLIGIFGLILFKEKLSARKAIGFGMIVIALALLNI